MKTKSTYGIIAVLSSLMLLTGCYGGGNKVTKNEGTGSSGGGTSDSANMLNLSADGEIPTLRANGTMDSLSQTMIQNLFEGLFRLDEDDEIIEGAVDGG